MIIAIIAIVLIYSLIGIIWSFYLDAHFGPAFTKKDTLMQVIAWPKSMWMILGYYL